MSHSCVEAGQQADHLSTGPPIVILSPRISNPMENNFLVPCLEIMGAHLYLFFGAVKIHRNPFLILLISINIL